MSLDAELEVPHQAAHPRGLLAAPRARTRYLQIAEVPRTLSGKVLEVPVKRILMGAVPSEAASVESLVNPHSLEYFVELGAAQLQSAHRASL